MYFCHVCFEITSNSSHYYIVRLIYVVVLRYVFFLAELQDAFSSEEELC